MAGWRRDLEELGTREGRTPMHWIHGWGEMCGGTGTRAELYTARMIQYLEGTHVRTGWSDTEGGGIRYGIWTVG